MRKKKKQVCSTISKHEDCNICSEQVKTCKPCKPSNTCKPCKPSNTCKKAVKKYVECSGDDYEITCVDKCVKVAKQAEELFEKALECECKATEAYEQAKECEKLSKVLSSKAKNLMKNAHHDEKESKVSECKAKELMEKSQELCEQAKCLYKEAEKIENEAECNCEKAKCLYEKAQEHNDMAKGLYNQALKCDEKALECYKTAEEKIKEYEMKSKKCEDMILKCSHKLDQCENKPKCGLEPIKYVKCGKEKECGCKHEKNKYDCYAPKKNYCKPEYKQKYYNTCYEEDEIIYIEQDDIYMNNGCTTYVSPMYDMCSMQYMGGFAEQYPNLDMPYMNSYINEY